jgi:hypothetical protein
VLYYGHVELTLTVRAPDGETATVEYGSHPTTGRYNAGFGQKDENNEALAQVLIASAQEAVALLNRDFFHLPPHPEVLSLVTRVATSPADEALDQLGESGHSVVSMRGVRDENKACRSLAQRLARE